MSELIVTVEKVSEVIKHPNADLLDIIRVKGWNCVVGKDSLKEGDFVVYIPIDSILPPELEAILFSDSKIKLSNSRIRTIKIRGAISQGLSVPLTKLYPIYKKLKAEEGFDCKDILGITKYEPKEPCPFTVKQGRKASKKQLNPNFKKYTDINQFNNYSKYLDPNMMVAVFEKIHGTNYRVGYVEDFYEGFFKQIWKLIKRAFNPERYMNYQFVFGSHNVQLQEKNSFNKKITGFKELKLKTNVYEEITKRYFFSEILKEGEVVYGEIYGDGIQKNYSYGLKNQIDLVVFDVFINNKFLSYKQLIEFCEERLLPIAPFIGTYKLKDINFDEIVNGPSLLNSSQKIKEGVVIRPIEETTGYMGRMIFKYINPEYLLLKGNTEWH